MATSNARITWGPVSGSTGYLVEYRLSGTTTWITPTSEENPTLSTFYDLVIAYNTTYDVRITSFGARCAPSSRTFQIFSPLGACCPAGYTLSVDSSYCYKINTTAATPPSAPLNSVASPYSTYGGYGTVIYNLGFDPGGFGPFTLIPLSNTFWSNTGLSTTQGPNNRTALWATTTTDNQDVGYSTCVTLSAAGVYYVGCFGDNRIRINVDGNSVVNMNVTNMANFFASNGYPGIGPFVTFYFWHVYPISLMAGSHVIEIIGHNDTLAAGMGTEVYNLTAAQLIAAGSYTDLGAGLIFSTKDVFGQPLEIGSGGAGYTCPSGYSLSLCSGAICTQTLTTPTISCTSINPVYWGVNTSGTPPPDSTTILAGSVETVDASVDVSIDWTSLTPTPQYCWVAIPDLGINYEKNHWFVDIINNGAIGGGTNLFASPTTVVVGGVNYLVWITNYETQFVKVCLMQKV